MNYVTAQLPILDFRPIRRATPQAGHHVLLIKIVILHRVIRMWISKLHVNGSSVHDPSDRFLQLWVFVTVLVSHSILSIGFKNREKPEVDAPVAGAFKNKTDGYRN